MVECIGKNYYLTLHIAVYLDLFCMTPEFGKVKNKNKARISLFGPSHFQKIQMYPLMTQ